MALDRFDDDIKNKLESHIEEYDSSTWDRLSSILDDNQVGVEEEDAISDDQMESIIKEKLQHLHTPLNEDHWLKLQTELDQQDARRERLWTIKLIEATILFLLLFTYWNFAGYPHYSPLEIDSGDNIEALHFAKAGIDQKAPLHLNNTKFGSTISEVVNKDVSVDQWRSALAIDNYSKTESNVSDLVVDQAIVLQSSSVNDIPTEGFHDENETTISRPKLSQDQLSPTEVDRIDRLSIDLLATDVQKASLVSQTTIFKVTDKKDKLENGFWLTLGFAKDVNLINSSVNIQTLSSYLRSGLYGTSASILAGYQLNNVEIESGIRFSEKNYAPGLIRSFSKAGADTYLETQLDEIQFKQIQIPVTAKLHAFNRTKSNLYILAGLGFNVITDYTFNTVKTVQPSSRVASLVDINSNDLSELPYGLTQGGPISDNYYTTAIVGFGFQTLMKNNTAIFFQPQYQFTISEGANDYIRKVHTFNVEAGVRFKF